MKGKSVRVELDGKLVQLFDELKDFLQLKADAEVVRFTIKDTHRRLVPRE